MRHERRHIYLALRDEVSSELERRQSRLVLRPERRIEVQPLAEERIPVERYALHRRRQTEHRDRAQWPHHLQRLVQRLHASARLDHHVRALAARQIQHRISRAVARNINRMINTHPCAMLTPRLHRLHRNDAVRPQPPQHEVMEQPDRPLPQHRHRLAQQRRQLARPEHHRPQLLRHQQVRRRHISRQLQQELLLDHLVAREHLRLPDVRRCQHQVPLGERSIARVHHLAHTLVPRIPVRQRKLVRVPAHIHDMQVAPAYRPQHRLHQRMPRLQRGYGHLVTAQFPQSRRHRRRHHSHLRFPFHIAISRVCYNPQILPEIVYLWSVPVKKMRNMWGCAELQPINPFPLDGEGGEIMPTPACSENARGAG